jgi:ATPases involved in chromosome partitioning
MSSSCGSGGCSSCGVSDCSARNSQGMQQPFDFTVRLNKDSSVKRVIGVMSGKGGVGKSFVTSMLAVKSRAKGLSTAILDADITGPSIPKAFGISGKVFATDDGAMIPSYSNTGITVISSNLLLDNPTDPVVWRGPIVASVVKQFWGEVLWGDVDVMYVDMPPGTGDVPLTVFQSIPVNGIIIVTSPQDLVSMIVAKAVNMAKTMNIPILGLVENMSYFECPDCKGRHSIFGESHIDEVAKEYGLEVLARIPIDPANATAIDAGLAEYLEIPALDKAVEVALGDL